MIKNGKNDKNVGHKKRPLAKCEEPCQYWLSEWCRRGDLNPLPSLNINKLPATWQRIGKKESDKMKRKSKIPTIKEIEKVMKKKPVKRLILPEGKGRSSPLYENTNHRVLSIN
jgi:hypothetical protein